MIRLVLAKKYGYGRKFLVYPGPLWAAVEDALRQYPEYLVLRVD